MPTHAPAAPTAIEKARDLRKQAATARALEDLLRRQLNAIIGKQGDPYGFVGKLTSGHPVKVAGEEPEKAAYRKQVIQYEQACDATRAAHQACFEHERDNPDAAAELAATGG